MEISELRQVIFLTGEQEDKSFIERRTVEQELIDKVVYLGSVGLMRSIPPSVEKTEEGLSKAL